LRSGNLSVLARLEAWGRGCGWAGPDPYEGLNSGLGGLAPGRRGRQAVTQVYKRLPFEPPWPLRAPRRANAKALALVLSGYASPAGSELPGAAEHLERLPRTLERMNLLTDTAGWGYHFDVQTRNISYSAATPNAIATCFVIQGLCDAYETTGADLPARLALSARPFLLSLMTHSADHGGYFSYVPGGAPLIHNANLLVCGSLARLHALEPYAAARDATERALETTLSLTRPDGLWPYGESPSYGWLDNFHTAYCLDGLRGVAAVFGLGVDALAAGMEAWRERFIEGDGWARYFPDRHFPLETHCSASSIDLLCRVSSTSDSAWHRNLALRLAESAIRELWLEDEGRFAFKRTRWGLNRREFMRWTNAPMFCALASLSSIEIRGEG
jgi:hypothetical protein